MKRIFLLLIDVTRVRKENLKLLKPSDSRVKHVKSIIFSQAEDQAI
jgi:hypothetical protein